MSDLKQIMAMGRSPGAGRSWAVEAFEEIEQRERLVYPAVRVLDATAGRDR